MKAKYFTQILVLIPSDILTLIGYIEYINTENPPSPNFMCSL